jgi:hypothetical protein
MIRTHVLRQLVMCDLNKARNFASCVNAIDSVFADEKFFKLFHY